ncbi:pirin family protein [Uliginosibacterium aquaticum]|uniref:Pirin family protein n=1 Tax=Uliginosibacterium aquaticum TaxID=2731212 RepID=A0ABX2IKW4_9RHOO|nr:pirin family protein [Uliginosibacterium aquaticum]NSL54971.1 pirin family protein [Uliginosibacterium aquaticum]
MSESHANQDSPSPITRIALRSAELGAGLSIRRALPTREQRMVGAWCFLDHIGPVHFGKEEGLHVGAHPHTALQTFTWMMEGEILHRDSLGSEQIIRPGQVNLMTAGRGISHTEDSVPDASTLHAAQLWIALPPEQIDIAPAFEHYPDLPGWLEQGLGLTLLVGDFCGRSAPVRVHSPLLGVDIRSEGHAHAVLPLRSDFEYALLPLEGALRLAGQSFSASEFVYMGKGLNQLELEMAAGSRALLLGGEPLQTPITMWWNFVGYSKPYIAQAQADWEARAARFGEVEGGQGRRIAPPKIPWAQ